jgi:hypothetical protein
LKPALGPESQIALLAPVIPGRPENHDCRSFTRGRIELRLEIFRYQPPPSLKIDSHRHSISCCHSDPNSSMKRVEKNENQRGASYDNQHGEIESPADQKFEDEHN